jgi:hypothetical protein
MLSEVFEPKFPASKRGRRPMPEIVRPQKAVPPFESLINKDIVFISNMPTAHEKDNISIALSKLFLQVLNSDVCKLKYRLSVQVTFDDHRCMTLQDQKHKK